MTARLAPAAALCACLALAACASAPETRAPSDDAAEASDVVVATPPVSSETPPPPPPAAEGAAIEIRGGRVSDVEAIPAETGRARPASESEPARATPDRFRERSEAPRRLDRDAERDTPREAPRWDPDPAPGLLTAGDVDDHLNFDFFLGWLDRTLGHRQQGAMEPLDLSDRLTLLVTDRAGEPVSGAEVRIEAEGGRRSRGLVTSAGTDGRLEIFPTYDFGRGVRELDLTVRLPGQQARTTETVRLGRLRGDRTLTVQLDADAPRRTRALDIAFAIDVTGSMGDELRYLTEEFRAIVERIEARYDGVDLRFGLVAYRDHGDRFVVRERDFTARVPIMQGHLADLRARGGGDYPEAMDEAMDAALGLNWRPEATRLLFLVADAPPHDGRIGDMMGHVREARASGIRMYPLAASGVAETAEVVMRTAAALTQGRYLFLTDDSGIGNTHAEPKVPCYVVTQLNDLLVRVIASELEGRRVEPRRGEVIREVGDYDAGVCEVRPVAQRPQQRPQRREGLGGYIAPGE
ncbi:MAG: VWA domain-containing protein [Bacteroidota bacterium]